MNVLIVGGGQVGSYLAALLRARGDRVTLVESRADVAAELRRGLGIDVVQGSGTDPEVLERAGIRRADVVAAVTGADEVNLAGALLARWEYGVARVAARVNDPHSAWLFTPGVGVDVAVNQTDQLAHRILEAVPDAEGTGQPLAT